MTIYQRLQNLSDDKLIDVVKNYKIYGYDEATKNDAIKLLIDREFSAEEVYKLADTGVKNFNEALRQSKAYNRNAIIGFSILVISLGTLNIVYIMTLFMCDNNIRKFYKALGKDYNKSKIYGLYDAIFYFRIKNTMKETLRNLE